MTIEEYEALTGISVPATDEARMTAVIARCVSRLESLLGYSLCAPKTWTEKGKVQYDGLVPFPTLPVSEDVIDKLLPPDPVTGTYQLFNFDELDKHIKINPAKQVYRAKVVLPINDDEFITIYRLENGLPYLNSAGLVTAVTRYYAWFTWTWWNSLLWTDRSNLSFAVEGNWFSDDDLPDELKYLLADMITYYSDENYSLMGNIRSESIDSHSYSRAQVGVASDGADGAAPEGQKSAKAIIEKYAGAGASRKLVR